MKFRIMGYEIDTQTENDYKNLGEKLRFLTMATFPELKVSDVIYDYDAGTNTARIVFRRNVHHHLDSGWIIEDDCQLVTAMDKEYFYPKVYGGKDEGYFGLVSYAGSWYASDDRVKKYFMDYQAAKDVKNVRFDFSDRYMEIKVVGF